VIRVLRLRSFYEGRLRIVLLLIMREFLLELNRLITVSYVEFRLIKLWSCLQLLVVLVLFAIVLLRIQSCVWQISLFLIVLSHFISFLSSPLFQLLISWIEIWYVSLLIFIVLPFLFISWNYFISFSIKLLL
jgi:hypothetical protein